jgi:hypothetical protein
MATNSSDESILIANVVADYLPFSERSVYPPTQNKSAARFPDFI